MNKAVTFDEWLEYSKTIVPEPHQVLHVDAMVFLSKSPSVSGYTTETDGTLKHKCGDLHEIKEQFDSSVPKILLHQVFYIPSQAVFKANYPVSMDVVDRVDILDDNGKPTYMETPSSWFVRYRVESD
jgi:hypothetical protein